MLYAKDIMKVEVTTVTPDTTVLEAAKAMVENQVSAVPVVHGSRLVGILSEGDLLHRAELGTAEHRRSWWLRLFLESCTLAEEYARSHSRRVSDVMTHRVYSVDAMTPVPDIVDKLERLRIKRVPVLEGQQVVGIVSRSDIVRMLISSASGQSTATVPPSNSLIRLRLLDDLKGQPWATADETDVEVENGIVILRGWIISEDERRATRVLAENVPGVKGVEDHRVVIDYPTVAL
ncbi:CBS domain-containing protein [Tianweitania sediminis]|uniref:CBS domain-containing protein n=1 Tax=Tianweitania sediminis TaxID=1502156 RepID=A0A8J7R5E3_9HYPH|nr:CBS domain-containing protein [Tianweitania sediminis]MBP0437997.1 CBS domain-containing protein [Tianweitania sediminis]